MTTTAATTIAAAVTAALAAAPPVPVHRVVSYEQSIMAACVLFRAPMCGERGRMRRAAGCALLLRPGREI
jgi:phage tail sheath gpL-like